MSERKRGLPIRVKMRTEPHFVEDLPLLLFQDRAVVGELKFGVAERGMA